MKTQHLFACGICAVMLAFAACEQTVSNTSPQTAAVTGVTLNETTYELVEGATFTLAATVAPANAANKAVTWASSAPAVATVDGGVVTAVATGTATITVTTADGSYTDTCTVTVKPVPVSIAVTRQPDKTRYEQGETLDITGIEVTATYSDNTTGIVAVTLANITGFSSSATGTKTLTVTYGGKTTTFDVFVVTVSSIAVTRQPLKTTYGVGDALDVTGIEVTATYSDGSTGIVTVTTANVTGFSSTTTGTKALTVTYASRTTTFTVSVMDVNIITITKQPDKTVYKTGETLDLTGLEVTVVYVDNTTGIAAITATNISGFNTATAGTKTLTITYGGKTATFTVTVKALTKIEVTTLPDKTVYKIGEQFDITGLVVTGTYSDNSTETVPVTASNIAGFNSSTAGEKTLIVIVGNTNTSFKVLVIEVTKIEVTRLPNKTVYEIGEQFEINGLVVIGTYSDNSTETVLNTAVNIAGFNSATAGEKTITVTFGGRSTTLIVTVLGDDIIRVRNEAEWNAARSRISNGGDNQSYTIVISGSVGVDGDNTTNTFGTVSNLMVRLAGNGRLSLWNTASLIRIGDNQTLIIESGDLTLSRYNNGRPLLVLASATAKLELRNGTITGNGNTSYYSSGGVFVGSGTFIMTGGTISGNTVNDYNCGGGVYVGSGSFTMMGGTISGNTATLDSSISSGGGGVYVGSGSFTMMGGTISGNTATLDSSSSSGGGGVYVSNGTFTMEGGTISGNSSSGSNSGGGVYVGGNTNSSSTFFTMTGGTISGNTSSSRGGGVYVSNCTFTMEGGTISGNNSSMGGGVSMGFYGSTSGTYFTMTGGTINGNTASDGGGVSVFTNGVFTMRGGEISGNIATNNGGGVYNGYLFRIVTGTIYGSNETNTNLRNTSNSSSGGAALYNGVTAQYGTLNGSTWSSNGNLITSGNYTNNTIRVVNGVLQ